MEAPDPEPAVDEEEPQTAILGLGFSPYEDDLQFGHEFTIRIGLRAAAGMEWWESTDRPYLAGQAPNTWTDMYAINPDSNVFGDWAEAGAYREITFIDPPSIRKEAGNDRTLSFRLFFAGDDDEIRIHAVQHLRTDAEGNITVWNFAFTDQQVVHG
jgi:hypothetical protein